MCENVDGGDDGASGALGSDPGVAASLEQTLKPRVERFQDPFSLGWYYRSCSASEGFGPSFYDVLWGCEPFGVNWLSTSMAEVQERAIGSLDRRNCCHCCQVFCRDKR